MVTVKSLTQLFSPFTIFLNFPSTFESFTKLSPSIFQHLTYHPNAWAIKLSLVLFMGLREPQSIQIIPRKQGLIRVWFGLIYQKIQVTATHQMQAVAGGGLSEDPGFLPSASTRTWGSSHRITIPDGRANAARPAPVRVLLC